MSDFTLNLTGTDESPELEVRCSRHSGMVVGACPGCLIEKNNKLARQLKHPQESKKGHWECDACGWEEPCRVASTGNQKPTRCPLNQRHHLQMRWRQK